MNVIKKLIIKNFFKLETVENLAKELQIGNYIVYVNKCFEIKFLITHISCENVITAVFHSECHHFGTVSEKMPPHITMKFSTEKLIRKNDYTLTIYKSTLFIEPIVKLYVNKFRKNETVLYLFSN